jgi:hypothetical protein
MELAMLIKRRKTSQALVAALVLAGFGVALRFAASSPAMAESAPDSRSQIAAVMRTVSTVAAAGGGGAPADFDTLRNALEASDELSEHLVAADVQREANDARARIRERIWRRGGSPQDLAALSNAQAACGAAAAAASESLSRLRAVAAAELERLIGPEDAATALRIQSNVGRNAPLTALCLDLTEDQWSTLEAGLNKRAAGATLTQEEQAVAAIYDSSPEVALVATRLAASKAEYDAYMAGLAAEIRAVE